MKAKRVLFYATFVPIGIFVFLSSFVLWFMDACLRADAVFHNLMARYEHWAFDVPKDYFFNSPWKYTLKEVWRQTPIWREGL